MKKYCVYDEKECLNCNKCEYMYEKKSTNWIVPFVAILMIIFIIIGLFLAFTIIENNMNQGLNENPPTQTLVESISESSQIQTISNFTYIVPNYTNIG